MQAQNGLYAARKTNSGVQSVFIDEELLEAEQLHKMTSANRRRAERDEVDRVAAADEEQRRIQGERRKMLRDRRRRQRAAHAVIKQELKLLGMAAVVAAAQQLGVVRWEFAAPVLIGIQTVVCFRAGKYFGRKR